MPVRHRGPLRTSASLRRGRTDARAKAGALPRKGTDSHLLRRRTRRGTRKGPVNDSPDKAGREPRSGSRRNSPRSRLRAGLGDRDWKGGDPRRLPDRVQSPEAAPSAAPKFADPLRRLGDSRPFIRDSVEVGRGRVPAPPSEPGSLFIRGGLGGALRRCSEIVAIVKDAGTRGWGDAERWLRASFSPCPRVSASPRPQLTSPSRTP